MAPSSRKVEVGKDASHTQRVGEARTPHLANLPVDDGEFQPFRVVRKDGIVTAFDVPCVDEHEVFGEDGKFVVNCDERMLRYIAANNNERIKQTGDEVPVTLGHTKDDAPEHEQPPLVGYARDFYVAPLMNAEGQPVGRHAVYARTMRFDEKDVEDFDLKRFPRRSVEIWFDKKPIIDPIALLGASTPERDLGLLRLSRKGQKERAPGIGGPVRIRRAARPIQRDRSFAMPPNRPPSTNDQDDLVARIVAAVMQTAPMVWAQQVMEDPMILEQMLERQRAPLDSPDTVMDQQMAEPGMEEEVVEEVSPEQSLDQEEYGDQEDNLPPGQPTRQQRRRYAKGQRLGGYEGEPRIAGWGHKGKPVRGEEEVAVPGRSEPLTPLSSYETGYPNRRINVEPTKNAKQPVRRGAREAILKHIRPEALPKQTAAEMAGYRNGQQHAKVGYQSHENPFKEGTHEYEGWMKGHASRTRRKKAIVGTNIPEFMEVGGNPEDTEDHLYDEQDFSPQPPETVVNEDAWGNGRKVVKRQKPIRREMGGDSDANIPDMEEGEEEMPIQNKKMKMPEMVRNARGEHVEDEPGEEILREEEDEKDHGPHEWNEVEDEPHEVGDFEESEDTDEDQAIPKHQCSKCGHSEPYRTMHEKMSAEGQVGDLPIEPHGDEVEAQWQREEEYVPGEDEAEMADEHVRNAAAAHGQYGDLPREPRGAQLDAQEQREREYVDAEDLEEPMMENVRMQRPTRPVKRSMGSTANGTNPNPPGLMETPSRNEADRYRDPRENPDNPNWNMLGVQRSQRAGGPIRRMRTNTSPQQELSQDDLAAVLEQLEYVRRDADNLRVQNERLAHEHNVLVRNQRQRIMRERLSRRERDLYQLQAENYEIDLNEEMGEPGVGDAYTLNDQQWDRKIGTIRKKYRRAPEGRGFPVPGHVQRMPQGTQPMTKEQMQAKVRAVTKGGAVLDKDATLEAYKASLSPSTNGTMQTV